MATLPPTTSSSQQPLNPEDEDGILDEYDQYSLAHPYIGRTAGQLFDFSYSSLGLDFLSQIAFSH